MKRRPEDPLEEVERLIAQEAQASEMLLSRPTDWLVAIAGFGLAALLWFLWQTL